jgi:hypothetical protein
LEERGSDVLLELLDARRDHGLSDAQLARSFCEALRLSHTHERLDVLQSVHALQANSAFQDLQTPGEERRRMHCHLT